MQQYILPALSPEVLIERWRLQGLYITDVSRPERHLKTVGYHRLNRYACFFRGSQGTFRAGISYDDIWTAYVFDRKLRLLTLDAIERVEVAVRTAMSDTLSLRHGPHWFMNAALFRQVNYAATFQKWVSSLALVRNVCAHHGMLWNRVNTRRPELQKNPPHFCPDFSPSAENYYATACIIRYFLKRIVRTSTWSTRLQELFEAFPSDFPQSLGFPENWYQDGFWGIGD